ncbi:MAG: PAS domain S-box protein, partial [Acetobacteraceae bacterium]
FGPLSKAWVAAAFAPVLQGDAVVAAMAVGLDLPELRELLKRHALRPGSAAMVVDCAGTIVARSDAQAPDVGDALPDWIRRAGQPDAPPPPAGAADGMVAVTPLVQARGWAVVVHDPAAASTAWRRPAPPLAAAAIFGIAAGAWLALLLARRCLQPVEALTQRAAAIIAGLPPDPAPPTSAVREFALLSTSLTAAHAALERQALVARQGQALLEAVIEGTPDVLHVKGLDGRTIVANAAADAFFQVPRGRLVGRRSVDLSRPEIAAVARAHDAQVLRDGRTSSEEYRIADPLEQIYKVTKAPLRNAADGRIAGIIILIQDVTRQRRTESELRRAEVEMQRLGRRATAGAMASGL